LVPTPNGLDLYLLGTPELKISGADSWSLRDQKATALLFYLAVTGRAFSRDHLANLLWGDSPESNARHSLRSSLYHLRQALASRKVSGQLVTGGDKIYLDIQAGQCDVRTFWALLSQKTEKALAEAVSLYRGPLLQGFTLTDAPVFEEWLRGESSHLSHAFQNALLWLLTEAESRQTWDKAIEYAETLVHLDPLDEAAERRLLRLYLESGALARALRHYQQFKETLYHELALVPAPETEELLQQVLRPKAQLEASNRTPAGIATPRAGSSGRLASGLSAMPLPMIGRNALLTQLFALADDCKTGRGATALLSGEAGMGKTRLLEELVAGLAQTQSQWMVLRGSCSPFDDLISYGPFYDALQSAAFGDLTGLLSVEAGNNRPEAGNILWRVLETVRLLTQGGPLLLTIEDLHWANSATLHMFGFLSTRIRALPVLLVGTIQHPESVPAIGRLIAVGRHRGEVHLLPLAPLEPGEVTELLLKLGFDPDSVVSLSGWLHHRSGGSPFILGEILAHLRTDRVVAADASGWHLDAACFLRERVRLSLPETTYDLLAWRLAALSPAALHLLDLLAVAGQPMPLAVLEYLTQDQAEQSLTRIEDLLARGLVVEALGEALTLPHNLVREALLSRLSHLRRRSLHLQILEALPHFGASDTPVGLRQLALHAVEGEDASLARRYGLEVLDALLQDEPSAETLRFLYQLRDLLLPTSTAPELMRLSHALGHLHQALGQIEAATRWHQQHLALAQQAGDISGQAAAYFELSELALISNDYATAAGAATSGVQLCESQDEANAAVLLGRGYRLLGAARAMEGSDLLGAVGYLELAAAAHLRAGSLGDLAADLFELGNVAAQRGELHRALSLYEQATEAAAGGHSHYFLALAYNNVAYHNLLLGRVEAALEAVTKGQRIAMTYELVGALLHLYSTQGEIYLYKAEWDRALHCFQRGLALAADLGNFERQAGYWANLALVARGQGDLTKARELLQDARALIAGQGYWHLHTRILLWLAETWWLEDSIDEAWPVLQEALLVAHSQGRELLVMQGERLRAQLLAAGGERSLADTVLAQVVEQASALDLALEVSRAEAVGSQIAGRKVRDPG
jgi:DNA-binding SARP family transcriptional activator/lipopolysaccharide biosynthesis regulator YciM